MKRKIFLGLGMFLIIIQFIKIDKINPSYAPSGDFLNMTLPDSDVKNLLQNACYDCHSYESEYPWHTNVSPISLWIDNHIQDGRKHLNFSIWKEYEKKRQDHKIDECIEMLEEGEMPLASFTWTHPEARLTEEQNQLLIDWFRSLK